MYEITSFTDEGWGKSLIEKDWTSADTEEYAKELSTSAGIKRVVITNTNDSRWCIYAKGKVDCAALDW